MPLPALTHEHVVGDETAKHGEGFSRPGSAVPKPYLRRQIPDSIGRVCHQHDVVWTHHLNGMGSSTNVKGDPTPSNDARMAGNDFTAVDGSHAPAAVGRTPQRGKACPRQRRRC